MEIASSTGLSEKIQRLSRAFKIICISLIPVFYSKCFRKHKWGPGIDLQRRYKQVRCPSMVSSYAKCSSDCSWKTTAGTSSLEVISHYFPLLLKTAHQGGWSHFWFGNVPGWEFKAFASTNTSSNRGDGGPGSYHPVPHSAGEIWLRCLLPVELQEEVVQNFLFRASNTMDDSKETSSARLVHATSHNNNCGIDFACAVKTHSC